MPLDTIREMDRGVSETSECAADRKTQMSRLLYIV